MTKADQSTAYFLGVGVVALIGAMLFFDSSAMIGVAAFPIVLLGAVIVWSALRGERFGTMALVFIAVFLIDAVFRRRDPSDKSLDYQVLMKVSVWLLMVVVSFANIRSWYKTLLLPSNMPWMIFLTWLCLTAFTSVFPIYTALTSFSIYAHAIFCAYVFTKYERVDVFLVIAASISVFCFISFIIYFAIPEYGRFIYWDNGELYLSNRMAGITGSANNLGRLAAVGLIITGIFAREFHRYHRFFVPLSVAIMTIVLIMTNSRSSMAMVIIILFSIYALNWRRLYLVVFSYTIGVVLLLIFIPIADSLLPMIARTGSIEEFTSLTGRTNIWNAVLVLASERPWTGYGYATSIFVLPENENMVGFSVGHAHNLFLQLLLTTGWIGVIFFAAAFFSVGLRAAYTRDWVVVALLAIVVLNGITEASGFTTLANICSLAFTIAITLPPQQSDRHEDHSAYQR